MDFYKKRTKEMYNKLKVTYPNNFARFKCIGGECEDTCCQGWDIEIDKDTFDEYLKVQDQKMKAMLSDNIKKNNYCTSDDLDYGINALNEEIDFLYSFLFLIINCKTRIIQNNLFIL